MEGIMERMEVPDLTDGQGKKEGKSKGQYSPTTSPGNSANKFNILATLSDETSENCSPVKEHVHPTGHSPMGQNKESLPLILGEEHSHTTSPDSPSYENDTIDTSAPLSLIIKSNSKIKSTLDTFLKSSSHTSPVQSPAISALQAPEISAPYQPNASKTSRKKNQKVKSPDQSPEEDSTGFYGI